MKILPLICLCLMLGVTACGSRDDMNNQNPSENNSMNNATENTQENTTGRDDNMQSTDRNENGGLVEDIGDAVGEGINDIGNGVEVFTDDMTGDYRENHNDSREQQSNN